MTHLDHIQLADYWLADNWSNDIEPARLDQIEEHLFECAQCTETLAWVASFTQAVQQIVRRGNLSFVLTPEFMQQLVREGIRVRHYAPPAGGAVQCTITSKDDLLMGILTTDLTSAQRVDALYCNEDGSLRFRIDDLPFRATPASELAFNYPIDLARASGHDILVIKLVDPSLGSDRLLAEFRFEHSPSA